MKVATLFSFLCGVFTTLLITSVFNFKSDVDHAARDVKHAAIEPNSVLQSTAHVINDGKCPSWCSNGVSSWQRDLCAATFPELDELSSMKNSGTLDEKLRETLALRSVYSDALQSAYKNDLLTENDFQSRSAAQANIWKDHMPPKRKIAVVTSIIEGKPPIVVNDKLLNGLEGYVDSTAAVAASVRRYLSTSELFEPELICYIMDRDYMKRYHRKLEAFGWRVVEGDAPVSFSEIKEGYYKTNLNASGCCGMSELMKLNAFTLTDYYRVLLLDSDAVLMGNIDELLNLPDDVGLIYTNGTMDGEIFQGGMWIVRPNMTVFNGMLDLIRRGAFYPGSAWEKSGVGWLYGGATIQGLVPFWFKVKEPPHRSIMVDRCTWNNQQHPICMPKPFEDIRMFHFTLCEKPFKCIIVTAKKGCVKAFHRWWEYTHMMEDYLGLERRSKCNPSHPDEWQREYQFIDLDRKKTNAGK